jgi:alpha-glucosidase
VEHLLVNDETSANESSPWWRSTTIYQVYPRSFQDSDGDGIGDLLGIISRLDYIKDLGFETIWLSPFFASPQRDFGYDISDYLTIVPEYGDLDVVGQLIDEIHERQMKVIFDMVMNHTSDQHPWFQESASSRDNPRADWYLWRDGRGGRPPNNWRSMLGPPGWHYVSARDQWYFASFLPFQPDLNYRNLQVKETMLGTVSHWLGQGVDGFRLDIFHVIYKDAEFRDNPLRLNPLPDEENPAGGFQKRMHTVNLPETMAFARELRRVTETFDEPPRLLLGEVSGVHSILRRFLGDNGEGLNLIFLFDMLSYRSSAEFFRAKLALYEKTYPAPLVPTYVFSNHDNRRSIGRVGGDHRKAKLLALFQFTVRGVAVTYYGEEIGMSDTLIPKEKALDPLSQVFGWIPQFVRQRMAQIINRDECRTPMQWNGRPNAGFCPAGVTPWLPLNPDYPEVNVASQLVNPDSLLNTYRDLLALRRQRAALRQGRLDLLVKGVPHEVLAYQRIHDQARVTVYINFSDQVQAFVDAFANQTILFTTDEENHVKGGDIRLRPLSGVVLERRPEHS